MFCVEERKLGQVPHSRSQPIAGLLNRPDGMTVRTHTGRREVLSLPSSDCRDVRTSG